VFTRSALEQSTIESYGSAVTQFERWRLETGFSGDVSDREIAAYVWVLTVERRLSSSYVKTTISALSDKYRFAAVNPTHSARVVQAKKAATKMAPEPVQRKPLTKPLILKIAAKMDWMAKGRARALQLRDLTMIVFAYRGFLRSSELVDLLATDVRIEQIPASDPDASLYPKEMIGVDLLWLYISSSKTNPQRQKLVPAERKGETVIIGPDRNSGRICPIALYKQWSFCRAATAKPFFHQLIRGKLTEPLSPSTYNHIVQNRMSQAGLDSSGFGGHSTRAGGCTDAIRRAVDIRSVKKHGRWSSDAVYLYIHNDVADTLAVNAALGGFDTSRTSSAAASSSSSSSSAGV